MPVDARTERQGLAQPRKPSLYSSSPPIALDIPTQDLTKKAKHACSPNNSSVILLVTSLASPRQRLFIRAQRFIFCQTHMMVADIPVLANTEYIAAVLFWVLIIDFHKVLISVLEPGLGGFKAGLTKQELAGMSNDAG